MMDKTKYVGFIAFTGDEPCKCGVRTQCLKECKTQDSDSIFT